MTYRSRSTRRVADKSKNRLILTLVICAVVGYLAVFWILPNLIAGIGFINNKKDNTPVQDISKNATFAPPVLSIPYEATNSSQIDIHGYATPGSKVNIYVDSNLKSTADVNSDGSFTSQNIDLSLGLNNILGKTVDDKNQESLPSKTIQLTLKTDKPNLDISTPSDGQVVHGGDKKITIQGKTDSGNIVTINGNQIVINADGSFSKDQGLNDGDTTFTIRSTDSASNYTELTRKVTYQSS